MEVEPRSFWALLTGPHPIIIPLLQRPYCWGERQLRGWWRDAAAGAELTVYHGATAGGLGLRAGAKQGKGRDLSRAHFTGKAMFKTVHPTEHEPEDASTTLWCIDGQQRLTTMQLLLAALRDAALAELDRHCSGGGHPPEAEAEVQSLVDALDALLFRDVGAMRAWAQCWASAAVAAAAEPGGSTVTEQWPAAHPVGERLPFAGGAQLVPSYVDRAPFFQLLTTGHRRRCVARISPPSGCPAPAPPPATALLRPYAGSAQALGKAIFDAAVEAVVAQARTGGRPVAKVLRQTALHAVHGVKLMYCEPLNEVNLPQVFLWMQEKSLFGMGALLRNNNPGLPHRPADLVRNLLLSAVMAAPLPEQERVLRSAWIEPLELPAGSGQALDRVIKAFAAALDEGPPAPAGAVPGHDVQGGAPTAHGGGRWVGAMEQDLLAMVSQARAAAASGAVSPTFVMGMLQKLKPGSAIAVYARVHSRAEELQRELEQHPPAGPAVAPGPGPLASPDRAGGAVERPADEVVIGAAAMRRLLDDLVAFVEGMGGDGRAADRAG